MTSRTKTRKSNIGQSSVGTHRNIDINNDKNNPQGTVYSNENFKFIVEDKIAPHNHKWFLKASNTLKTKLRKKEVPLLYAMREESRMKTDQKEELKQIIKELPKPYKIDVEKEAKKKMKIINQMWQIQNIKAEFKRQYQDTLFDLNRKAIKTREDYQLAKAMRSNSMPNLTDKEVIDNIRNLNVFIKKETVKAESKKKMT